MSSLSEIEPLFRLIEVCLVAVITLIVSVNANLIARQANMIGETELKVIKEANQPYFTISQIREADLHGEENANSVLYIYNTAGSFNSINIDTACFVEFTHFDNTHESMRRIFSLRGFYFIKTWTKQPNDLLCKVSCDGNWRKFHNLYMETLDGGHGYVDLRQYVKISYTDIYGEDHTNYYLVNEVSQTRILESEGERIFRQYDELNEVDIDNLSLSVLLNDLEQ